MGDPMIPSEANLGTKLVYSAELTRMKNFPMDTLLCKQFIWIHIYYFKSIFKQNFLLQRLPATVFPADNLKLDYHDHPETVSVTLYVKQIDKESLQVEFSEKNVSVFFRTRYWIKIESIEAIFLKCSSLFAETHLLQFNTQQWILAKIISIGRSKLAVLLNPTIVLSN